MSDQTDEDRAREAFEEAPLQQVQCFRCYGEGVVGQYDFERPCPECNGDGWLVEEVEPNDGEREDDD